jgi:hypothetical protein
MKDLKAIRDLVLGTIVGLGAQWLSLIILIILPIKIRQLDPISSLPYSAYNSIGLIIALISAAFFLKKRNWPSTFGILLGSLLWFPALTLLLGVSGL